MQCGIRHSPHRLTTSLVIQKVLFGGLFFGGLLFAQLVLTVKAMNIKAFADITPDVYGQ